MFPVEDNIQITSKKKRDSESSQLLKLRDLHQNLDFKYKISQFILLFLAVDNRNNASSRYNGMSVNQICELFKVPRSTYYTKRKLYEAHGMYGLITKKRGPKTGSRIEPELKKRIVELRDKQLSTRAISTMIAGQSLGTKSVAISTMYRFLRSIGKNRLPRNKKPAKQVYKRFERKHPNSLWQIDNVGPFYKPGKLFAYDIVDDHSRYSLGVMIADNQRSDSWVKFFKQLFEKYGTPKAILHDHGSQFVAPSTNNLVTKIGKLFEDKEIRSVRARVRHPETCGKVEKFQQSLMHEIREIIHTNTIEEFQETVDAWRDYYNIARIHQSTGVTPYERYFGKAPDPELIQQACNRYEDVLDKYPVPQVQNRNAKVSITA